MSPASGRHAGRPSASAAQAPTRKVDLSAGRSPVNARLMKPRLAKRALGSIKTDNKNGYRSGGGRDRVGRAVGRASLQALDPGRPAGLFVWPQPAYLKAVLGGGSPDGTTVGGLFSFLVPCAAEAQQAGKWMARLGIDAGSSARNAALGFARVPPHTDMAWEARHGRQPKGVPLGRRLDLQEGERSDHLPTSRK